MRRRELLGGVSLLAASALAPRAATRALAGPGAVGGPAGLQTPRLGPVGTGAGLGGGAGPASAGSGPSLDLNFLNTTTLDPRITFTRASTVASYFDATGTLQNASTNVPRFDYDPVTHASRGLLIEEARTNSIRNSTMVGVAAGTPGTAPTNYLIGPAGGLSSQIVGSGTESGILYFDLRFFGTAAGGNASIKFEPSTGCPGLTAQTYTLSVYLRLVAGSFTNVASGIFVLDENTSGGSFVANTTAALSLPGAAVLASQRPSGVLLTHGGATTANLVPWILLAMGTGAVDFTLRIGAPQLELGAFATSFIPTSTVAVTRAADVATLPVTVWTGPGAFTWQAEFTPAYIQAPSRRVLGANASGAALLGVDATHGFSYDTVSVVSTANGSTVGAVNKIAATWGAGVGSVCVNGGAVVSGAQTAGWGTPVVRLMGDNAVSDSLTGYLRRVRFWPRALAVAELQAATT